MGGWGLEVSRGGGSLAASLVLIVVCLLVLWLLRRLRRQGGGGAQIVRVLGHCPLEAHRSLYVIEAAGRCFLLGVGEGSPSFISELDPGTVPRYSLPARRRGVWGEGLARLLRRRA
ncbi:MAG: flagellar biosynthetic protein FliO [Polyangia bacterium]|jgi:flagellar biogenesis protein FliO